MCSWTKTIRSGKTRSERGKPRSPAWSAVSRRFELSWLRWRLLTAYDRLLRRVCLAAVALAAETLRRRKTLALYEAGQDLAAGDWRRLSYADRKALLALGFEPVPPRAA